jgi:Holliday junction resolvase
LPDVVDFVPKLRSRGSLTDSDFAIQVAGWVKPDGTSVTLEALAGGVVRVAGKLWLLQPTVWRLMDAVARFAARPNDERTAAANRRSWGSIRSLALEAGAQLDQFLVRSVVVTPETLDIDFRRATVAGETVVEIAPSFQGAPENWLEFFDRDTSVPENFNIPTPAGVVHVALSEPVRSVLREVKRLPGRRVTGSRAEAFLLNPVAALGSDAASVIDLAQFENAKSSAGISFERFRPAIEKDALGFPHQIGLHIDAADGTSTLWKFSSDEEACSFAAELKKRLRNELQILAWKGFEFELDGDASRHLEVIEAALAERAKPPIEIHHDRIFDLTKYADRISGIGANKDFISVYIVKRDNDDGWFPANLMPVLKVGTGDSENNIGIPIAPADVPGLTQDIAAAKERGATTISVPGFTEPLPLDEVEKAVKTIANALNGSHCDPSVAARETMVAPQDRPTLLIKGNMDAIDHREDRADHLEWRNVEPHVPICLKSTTKLRDHQKSGVARLQQLFAASPQHCRGVLLADDMGLGKTIQLLTFIASEYERDSTLPPAIIVAPVSLLENWKQEISNFFEPGALRILTAYGDDLHRLRVPRESIDEALRKDGLVKFLKDGWRGDAQVVLTTYETLRDLEFSFAQETWSILVCDEAQKIKNPNAMITRAAKKLNVRFRVACTGTPVENSLVDIWCLFDLIQPGLLGALNEFGRTYGRPIESNSSASAAKIEELHRLIASQVIRRTKKDVAKELKEKIIVPDLRLDMSQEQRSLYLGTIDRLRMNGRGEGEDGLHHFAVLQYLRLVCADPREYETEAFVPEDPSVYRRRSPKMHWLLKVLHQIRDKQEKALVFAEYRDIQRLLRHYIQAEFGIKPAIVNGETAVSSKVEHSRLKTITAFQDSPGFGVLILSPVAVGYGVNIQAANHVVHFLRHWNPAKEDQATDRAYRIGQEKDVFVYCPLSVAPDFKTFDVKLDELLTRKRALATDMLNPPGEVKINEMDLLEIVPGGFELPPDELVTLDKLERIKARTFEGLAAVLWQKQGYDTTLTPASGDAGVDVVGIRGQEGVLIQCKSSTLDTLSGWEAAKEVTAGAAFYANEYPGVAFKKIALTNRRFNARAKERAAKMGVVVIEQAELWRLIEQHPIGLREVAAKLAESK